VPTGGRSSQKSVKVYALDKYSEHYKKNVVITDLLKTKIKYYFNGPVSIIYHWRGVDYIGPLIYLAP
jgi:hypothetical protein